MEGVFKKSDQLKEDIFNKIVEYYQTKKIEEKTPDQNPNIIRYTEAIFDDKEVNSVLNSLFQGWLGLGPKGRELSQLLSNYLRVNHTILVNSGSSANLLALAALKSHNIPNCLSDKDEIITPAVTFPTTLNPIILNNLTPRLVDIDLKTNNLDSEKLNEAINAKTRVILIPHTLGNPNDMDTICDIADEHDLFIIEDNCDSLGSEYNGKKTGSFGILSTCSFYPAHHITTGEGGSVSVVESNPKLNHAIQSLRDWGRDCWCASDEKSSNGACQKRFDWKIGNISYDHRYIYSHIGYNLKMTEMQAAMGVEQFNRLEGFIEKRRYNFNWLYSHLKVYENYLSFIECHKKANPSWFAFPIRINDNAPFTRQDMIIFLESHGIQTRLIFAGNISKQPAYKNIDFKNTKELINSNKVMENSFFIGIHPGMDYVHLSYVENVINSFMEIFA